MPGAVPQRRTVTTPADRRGSWMLPEAKGEDLLYASDNTGNKVWVFSYPKAKLVGTLTGFYAPMGACVDKAGNVWIVNWQPAEVIEYSHGGTTPIATLSAGASPFGCAIDPRTGNLAVINYHGSGNVAILIFPNAQYPPTIYPAYDFPVLEYGGYDDESNFFSVGYSKSLKRYALAELQNGSNELKSIPLNRNIKRGWAVQWDGKALAIGGYEEPRWPAVRIYRVTVSGSQAQIIGNTRLKNRGQMWQQFWIQGHTIIQGSNYLSDLSYWAYPKGGVAIKTINGVGQIWGVVVSVAASHKQ
jgi:hypothetical protein